jgi:hypothetical protein
MQKLTFKEYVESKAQLLEAVKETPMQEIEYDVRKYCKIPLGESKEEKEYVALKPKHTMVVKWLYEDIDNPTPMGVWFYSDNDDLNHLRGTEFDTFWSSEKLQKWLARNARERFNV